MNETFSSLAFWTPYLTLEPGNLKDADFAKQRELLRRDFVVRELRETFEMKGQQHSYTWHSVDFNFQCGERHSMVLEYHFLGRGGFEQYLYLYDQSSRKKSEMGWWDLARWHPYCLRLEELESLLRYWTRYDAHWPTPEIPLLLLAKFVGLSNEEHHRLLAARVSNAWHAMGFPLAVDSEGRSALELFVKDKSRWIEDEELGWVFHGEEYSCYSIRNRPHAQGSEGRFPFRAFAEMMKQVSALDQ